MPCSSEHLEPTAKERYRQRTARLYIYAWTEMGMGPVLPEVYAASNDPYCTADYTNMLCALIGAAMSKPEQDRIVYNARDPRARDLADWWEAHEQLDADKAEVERRRVERARLRASARAKLTPEEAEAVGLSLEPSNSPGGEEDEDLADFDS